MPDVKVVKVPMYDTGLGKEAGYANDQALIEAARAERASLSLEVRVILDKVDLDVYEQFLFGDSS